MGFGPTFREWILLINQNTYSKVLVNGFLSELFSISRGVRQGCPLSPLLYILIAECLGASIRKEPNILGFRLPGSNSVVKLTQYADDTTVFVTLDSDIIALFDLFSSYEKATGAKLNLKKCKGLLLGPWQNKTTFPVPLQWKTDFITCLGTKVSINEEQNWTKLLNQLNDRFSMWKLRDLSFQGRALIASSLGLSTFWYIMSCVYTPDTIIKDINKLLFPFVWGKKGMVISIVSCTTSFGRRFRCG